MRDRQSVRRGTFARYLLLLALSVATALPARAATVFAVDAANNLVRFKSSAPGTIQSSTAITGLASGDSIVAIDFRPLNEQLLGLGSSGRLYLINQVTGVATQVGTAVTALAGTSFGFDVNPTVDRIRVVSDADQNLRLNPNDGSLAATDATLAYASGDPNNAANPNIVGSAYTNSVANATTTTLYGIDSNLDVLVTQNPPNAGTLNTVGALGVNASDVLGFDIEDTTNTAFASLVVGGVPRLYTINLGTGTATLVGTIGPSLVVRGIALAPQGFDNSTLAGTTATFNGSPAGNSVTFDQSGGLLRHNRFSAGDDGFNSDFDFDPSTPGDQTLSASDASVTIIVNGGQGDDRITIGSNSSPASALACAFQINGQGGGDGLVINDSTDATSRTVAINGSSSSIGGIGGPITYSTLELLNIATGSGADVFNVSGGQTALTSIDAGGGDDRIAFAAGASLGGIVDGGSGTNTLTYAAYTTPVAVDLHETDTIFLAILSGQQEPGPLSNSPASGRAIFSLNAAHTALQFAIVYSGLTGSPISGAHFHNQIAGINGPIVRGLTSAERNGDVTPAGTYTGTWSTSDPTLDPPDSDAPIRPLNAPSPVTPGATLVDELLANRIYFDIHTLPNFPSGEIRGQVINFGTAGKATGTAGVRSFSTVIGGSNNDTITGTTGAQTLSGGAGADTFIWNNGDGSDVIDGDGDADTVQVNGSPTGDDQFLLQVNPSDPNRLRFDRTNLGLFNLNIGTVEALEFNTLGGNDTMTLDFASGNPIPVNGIDFDGGGDSDQLVLQRSAGSFTASTMTHVGVGPGAGSIDVDGRSIVYSGLAPVNDTVPTANYTFTAPAGSAALHVVDGPIVSGSQTVQINSPSDAFELVNLGRKTNITINTGSVAQSLVVNNPTATVDLASLTLNSSTAEDDINVTAVPPGVSTRVNALGQNDIVHVTGAGVPTGATLLLDGGNGFDRLIYETGAVPVTTAPGPGAGQTTITRPGSGTVVYQNFEDVTYNFGSINLVKLTNGTDNDSPPGPSVDVGSTVTFTYRVTNPGNVPLNNVVVTDDSGTPSDTSDDFSPAFVGGDSNGNGLLDPPETWTFTATRIATAGQYTNIGTVTADQPPASGGQVSDSNPDNHFGISPSTPAQPLNISTRVRVQSGDNVLIGGFIIDGNEGKKVIVRALGPSLATSGVVGVLADPVIELRGPGGDLIASNDNWRSDQEAEIQASGVPPPNDLESAIVATLPPDGYTVIVRSKEDLPGVGLVEVFDLNPAADSALANISTRGFVETGENVMIGGFILGGTGGASTRVALRGLGPSLEQQGVSATVLEDPTLDLYDSNGTRLIFNDNWMDNPAQAVQLSANGLAPTNNLESGIFMTLPPGAYTAILAGKDDGTGIGLVEIYDLR